MKERSERERGGGHSCGGTSVPVFIALALRVERSLNEDTCDALLLNSKNPDKFYLSASFIAALSYSRDTSTPACNCRQGINFSLLFIEQHRSILFFEDKNKSLFHTDYFLYESEIQVN